MLQIHREMLVKQIRTVQSEKIRMGTYFNQCCEELKVQILNASEIDSQLSKKQLDLSQSIVNLRNANFEDARKDQNCKSGQFQSSGKQGQGTNQQFPLHPLYTHLYQYEQSDTQFVEVMCNLVNELKVAVKEERVKQNTIQNNFVPLNENQIEQTITKQPNAQSNTNQLQEKSKQRRKSLMMKDDENQQDQSISDENDQIQLFSEKPINQLQLEQNFQQQSISQIGIESNQQIDQIQSNTSSVQIKQNSEYLQNVKELHRLGRAISISKMKLFELSLSSERWSTALQLLQTQLKKQKDVEDIRQRININSKINKQKETDNKSDDKEKSLTHLTHLGYLPSFDDEEEYEMKLGEQEQESEGQISYQERYQFNTRKYSSQNQINTNLLFKLLDNPYIAVNEDLLMNKQQNDNQQINSFQTSNTNFIISKSSSSNSSSQNHSQTILSQQIQHQLQQIQISLNKNRKKFRLNMKIYTSLFGKSGELAVAEVLQRDYSAKQARQQRASFIQQTAIQLLCQQQARHAIFIDLLKNEIDERKEMQENILKNCRDELIHLRSVFDLLSNCRSTFNLPESPHINSSLFKDWRIRNEEEKNNEQEREIGYQNEQENNEYQINSQNGNQQQYTFHQIQPIPSSLQQQQQQQSYFQHPLASPSLNSQYHLLSSSSSYSPSSQQFQAFTTPSQINSFYQTPYSQQYSQQSSSHSFHNQQSLTSSTQQMKQRNNPNIISSISQLSELIVHQFGYYSQSLQQKKEDENILRAKQRRQVWDELKKQINIRYDLIMQNLSNILNNQQSKQNTQQKTPGRLSPSLITQTPFYTSSHYSQTPSTSSSQYQLTTSFHNRTSITPRSLVNPSIPNVLILSPSKIIELLKNLIRTHQTLLKSLFSLWPVRLSLLRTLAVKSSLPIERALIIRRNGHSHYPVADFTELISQTACSITKIPADHIFTPPTLARAIVRLLATRDFIELLCGEALQYNQAFQSFNSSTGFEQSSNYGLSTLQKTERQLFALFFNNPSQLRIILHSLEDRVNAYTDKNKNVQY